MIGPQPRSASGFGWWGIGASAHRRLAGGRAKNGRCPSTLFLGARLRRREDATSSIAGRAIVARGDWCWPGQDGSHPVPGGHAGHPPPVLGFRRGSGPAARGLGAERQTFLNAVMRSTAGQIHGVEAPTAATSPTASITIAANATVQRAIIAVTMPVLDRDDPAGNRGAWLAGRYCEHRVSGINSTPMTKPMMRFSTRKRLIAIPLPTLYRWRLALGKRQFASLQYHAFYRRDESLHRALCDDGCMGPDDPLHWLFADS